MGTCKPWCGIGVRHIQYILMASMNCLDFWINALTFAAYLDKQTSIEIFSRKERQVTNTGHFVITPHQKLFIQANCYGLYTLSRFSAIFLVHRVPNKYTLLSLIFLENGLGAIIIWFIGYFKFIGVAVFLGFLSVCRAHHSVFMMNILSKWMPPMEYTTTFCIITITKEMFSFLLNHYGLGLDFMQSRIAFMLLTFTYLGWCVLFLIFGAESPQTSYLISKQEWNFLSKHVGPRKKIMCQTKSPWKAMFTTIILYAYVLLDFGKESNGATISKAVSVIASANELSTTSLIAMQATLMAYCFTFFVAVCYLDRAIGKQKIVAGPFRKVMTTTGSCGIAITMILAAYVDNHYVKFGYLFLAQCFFVIVHTAEPAILFDVSPNYAAQIYAIISFVRNCMLLVKMSVDPKFRDFDLTLKGNNTSSHIGPGVPDGMIYRYGFLVFFTNLFFIISGNIELKEFDSYDTYDWRKESTISYP